MKKKAIWIISVIILMTIFFPKNAHVQISVPTSSSSPYIEFSVDDKNGNSVDYGSLFKYYGQLWCENIPLRCLLWNADSYHFFFYKSSNYGQFEPGENLIINNVTISFGDWKLYQLNTETLEKCSFWGDNFEYAISDEGIDMKVLNGIPMLSLLDVEHSIFKPFLTFVLVYVGAWILIGIAGWYFGERLINNIILLKKHCLKRISISGALIIHYAIAIVLALLLAQFVIQLESIFNFELYVQKEEWYFYWMALSIMSIMSWNNLKDRKLTFALTVVLAVPIYFSVGHLSSYLTVDEPGAISEQLYLSSDVLRHWAIGNARTNYLIMGTLLSFTPQFLYEHFQISARAYAKLLHWFCGFLLTHWAVCFCLKKMIKKSTKAIGTKVFIIGGLYLAFLTSAVFNMATANYNYDLFSMMFGMLAILYAMVAFRDSNIQNAYIAVVTATLGVQEKVLVAPVVVLASSILVYILLKRHLCNGLKKIVRAGIYGICAVLIQCAVCLFTHWWVLNFLKGGQYPIYPMNFSAVNVIRPLVVIFTSFTDYNIFIKIGLLWLCISVGGLLLCMISRLKLSGKLEKCLLKFGWSSILLYLLIGVIGQFRRIENFFVNKYIAFCLMHIRIVVSALPTAVLAALIGLSLYKLIKTADIFEMVSFLYLTVINTGLYTILNKYGGTHRYSNVYILSLTVLVIIAIINMVDRETYNGFIRGCMITACAVSIFEMATSARFSFIIYRPMWDVSIYYTYFGNRANWMHLKATAGETIEKYCKKNGINLNNIIIIGNGGAWESNDYNIPIIEFGQVEEITEDMLTEQAFWVIDDRNYNTISFLQPIPIDELVPVINITYRGATVARIYRGNQIKDFLGNYGK